MSDAIPFWLYQLFSNIVCCNEADKILYFVLSDPIGDLNHVLFIATCI